MKAITNFLTFLNENWTLILVCLGAIAGIVAKTKNWMAKSQEEKKEAAIEAIRRSMLALVTEAEREYGSGTGTVKRADVLARIFTQYPILAEVMDIEDTTEMLDEMIDEALVTLRALLEDNEAFFDLINNTITLTGAELATCQDLADIQFGKEPDNE